MQTPASTHFWRELDARLASTDLLTHPYYQAWSKGELCREDLAGYAAEYWHHVSAFPTYLSALHARLPDGELRREVLQNLVEEEGMDAPTARPHADLWMDFATGMGAEAAEVRARELEPETAALIAQFRTAMQLSPAEALATLYAYESRVPAIAAEKAAGLQTLYSADSSTRRYFTLHQTADVAHAAVWRGLIDAELARHPEQAEAALDAAERAGRALWRALDGVERVRQAALQPA